MSKTRIDLSERLILIGLMGTGKSTLGAMLAAEAGVPFADSDAWIERETGMSVGEIFDRKGAAFFREQEACFVAAIPRMPICVIATGGGLPCHNNQIETLLILGRCVHLDGTPELLARRIRRQSHRRPLLDAFAGDLERAMAALIRERADCYGRAHARLALRDEEPENTLNRIIEMLKV